MRDAQQTCDAIEDRPEVITVALVGRAGMQRHAYTQSFDCRKIFGGQRLLRGQHSCNGVFRAPEGRAKCIADRLEHVAAVLGDRCT
jgi:hypothetical protein